MIKIESTVLQGHIEAIIGQIGYPIPKHLLESYDDNIKLIKQLYDGKMRNSMKDESEFTKEELMAIFYFGIMIVYLLDWEWETITNIKKDDIFVSLREIWNLIQES
jgi:hypothetical protein